MRYIGIDIGSTSAKTVVMEEDRKILCSFTVPTGWSSFDAGKRIETELQNRLGKLPRQDFRCVSTGYGRQAVSWAERRVTEITCHSRGASFLFGDGLMNVIDIGGQDTKVISVTAGKVDEFFMNEKCAAGTGKFLEVLSGRLNIPPEELDLLASHHTKELVISSMCTVFAESEVVSLAGQGESKENLAFGVLHSVAEKVSTLYGRLAETDRQKVVLTGGLCSYPFFQSLLSDKIGQKVVSAPMARYAGAIGAAMMA